MLDPLVWLIIGLALIGLEMLAPSFTLFWFGLGAILTSVLVKLGVIETWQVQWLVFLLSSFFLVLLWQFWLKKYFRRQAVETDRDATVSGQMGVITKEVTGGSLGEVELAVPLHGVKRWAAEANEGIPVGTTVRVIEARGIRLFVEVVHK